MAPLRKSLQDYAWDTLYAVTRTAVPRMEQGVTSVSHCLQTPVNYTDTCNVADPSEVEASVTPPSAMAQGVFANGDKAPPQTPPPVTDGTCNKYLPNDSTFNRYIWVARCAPGLGCAVLVSTGYYLGRALLSTVTDSTCSPCPTFTSDDSVVNAHRAGPEGTL